MSNELLAADLINLLPHRYPFLLIDRVTHFVKNKSVQAIKNVTLNEPFFQGHFPGMPVMPGVLMVEAMAQAAGIIVLKSDASITAANSDFFLAGIDKARFKRVVIPGDCLTLNISLSGEKKGIYRFDCQAMVGDELACSAMLMTARRAKS